MATGRKHGFRMGTRLHGLGRLSLVLWIPLLGAGPVRGQGGEVHLGEGSSQGDGGARQQAVALVTGSTDGLGREVALRLAASGMHVIVHGRNVARGEELVRQIQREGKGSAAFYRADFSSLAEVRELGRQILRDYQRLDVLVNNAGIWLANQPTRQLSADGYEMHFQVNYLAGVLLTRTLLPLLEKSAPARVVNVASGAQRPVDFQDVMLERGYSASRGYAQSKLAQVMFTFDLAAELEGRGITVNTLHPATYMDTRMVRDAGVRPRSTVAEGAEAVMHLITASDVGTGRYYEGLRPARANRQAYDEDARRRLAELTDRLLGPVPRP